MNDSFPPEGRTEHGDRDIARNGEILRTEVGSGLHGIAIAGTDDHDEMGVFVEPPSHVIGLSEAMDSYVSRTQAEGERSGPGDTDLVMYSLRKYLTLATAGNPTVLLPLFAPESTVYACTELGNELRAMGREMLSQHAVRRFLGYMDGQRDRLLASGRKGEPIRPELVEQYGYDVKYASHALRLAYQGLEIAEHGQLTLPMPANECAHVRAVKAGEVNNLDEVLDAIAERRERIVQLLDSGKTPLPEHPDDDKLSTWLVSAHRRHWQWGDA